MRGRRDRGWGRWAAVGVLVVVAAFFSFLNAGERVSLDIGVTTLYRVSLVGLVFAVFLLGMVAMFLFGLRHDRQIRDALKSSEPLPPPSEIYPFEPPPEPPV